MKLLSKALEIWYSGAGLTLISATCPLIAGSFCFSLLLVLQRWYPTFRALWRRILFIPPATWISLAIACSLASTSYAWSLLILDRSDVREGLHFTNAQAAIPYLWIAVFGVLLTICNITSIQRILVEPLSARNLWLSIRQKWPQDDPKGDEHSLLLVHGVRFYIDGASVLLSDQRLPRRLCRLAEVIPCLSARRKMNHQTADQQPPQPYFTLERKRQEWEVIVPKSHSGWTARSIVIRQPWLRATEEVTSGCRREVQAGHIIGFKGEDSWYLLVESTYP